MAAFVTVSQLQKGWSKRALLVDVRSVSEFAAGHIAGAVNIPMVRRGSTTLRLKLNRRWNSAKSTYEESRNRCIIA